MPAEPGILCVEKIGKSKIGITDGEGLEYPSLQVLGECTGAFAVALSVLGRRWQDWCCAMVGVDGCALMLLIYGQIRELVDERRVKEIA